MTPCIYRSHFHISHPYAPVIESVKVLALIAYNKDRVVTCIFELRVCHEAMTRNICLINYLFSFWQTVFIISVCNNQLLDWIENELIWMLSFIPGVSSALPSIVAKLHAMKEKYMAAPLPVTSNIKVRQ